MTITADTRAKAAEARAQALIENTELTTRPGSESTTLKVGDIARVADTVKRYFGRHGTVTSINRQMFPFGRGTYVEVGLHFGSVKDSQLPAAEAHAWFRADELKRA